MEVDSWWWKSRIQPTEGGGVASDTALCLLKGGSSILGGEWCLGNVGTKKRDQWILFYIANNICICI